MKVLILGGYGVFGGRLARLLVKDGHDVCVAGRNLTSAAAFADRIGAVARQVDRAGQLDMLADYDVVVDAAGPFHAYGGNPYRVPKAAMKAGTHYLDLSDNAAFCAGIAQLDGAAKEANLCVLSGLSSVPAVSSAAVVALAGEDKPDMIESAILPGNRSPRGLSVMDSILSQAGQPMSVWRGGQWEQAYGWCDPKMFRLSSQLTRQGWQISVPDQHLFPAYFKADSVTFHAGLELATMRYGLAAFAWLRRYLRVPHTRASLLFCKLVADGLAPFGSGTGGMSVTVAVGAEHRMWRLVVEDGDGPFVPAIAARSLLRRDQLPLGAGPAIGAVTLDEVEDAMSDISATTERLTQTKTPLFQDVLGGSFDALPSVIQATHQTVDKSRWRGQSTVVRGKGIWARLLGAIFQFPAQSDGVPVTVTKSVTTRGETWLRSFGGKKFRSRLASKHGRMAERFGPFTFVLDLNVDESELYYPVAAGYVGFIPLPKWLLPVSDTRELVVDGVFNFDVAIYAPVTKQLVVRYRGWLKPEERGDPSPQL